MRPRPLDVVSGCSPRWRALSLTALAALLMAGCERDVHDATPTTQPAKPQQVFRTADFEFRMPGGWQFLESESISDRAVFQSSNGRDRLTLSIMRLKRDLSDAEAQTVFGLMVERRRKAEAEAKGQPQLTDQQIVRGDGYWYSKWTGHEPSADRRTGTLITLENKKLYTLYLESQYTSDITLKALAVEVFGNFKAK